MAIEVVGPDGVVNEFPDGTPDSVIKSVMARQYRADPATKRADQQAVAWAATRRPETPAKRGVFERLSQDFSDALNTSWVMEGYRKGLKDAVDANATKDPKRIQELAKAIHPFEAMGQIVGGVTILGDEVASRLKGTTGHENATRMIERDLIGAEAQRRAEFTQASRQDPWYNAEGGLVGTTVHGSAALVGTLAAAAADPATYITAGRSLLARAATQAVVAAGFDLAAQQGAIGSGLQQDYSVSRAALAAATGGAFTVASEAAIHGVKGLASRLMDGPEAKVRDVLEVADDINAPALSEAEMPKMAPRKDEPLVGELLEKEAPEATAGAPKETPEAPAADPWDPKNWGSKGSPERAAAAIQHLDKLRTYIKPEAVNDFLKLVESGGLRTQAAEGVIGEGPLHLNARYIDWDKINEHPEDILSVTHALGDIFKDTFDHAGDRYRSWEQTQAASRLFGTNLSDIVKTHADITAEGGISARLAALQEVALASDAEFVGLLRSVEKRMSEGDFSGATVLAQGLQRTLMLDAMAAGAKSEVARALNYMKALKRPRATRDDLQGLIDDLGVKSPEEILKTVRGLREAYETGGSPKLRETVRKMRQMGAMDYIGYVFTGNLLSAPKTHLRNLVGTPLHAAFQITERYVAAGLGAGRQAFGLGSKERVTFREAWAYSTAMGGAFQDALRVGLKAFAQGAPVTDAASSVLPDTASRQGVPFAYSADRVAKWRNMARQGNLWSAGVEMGLTGFFETIRTFGYRPSVAADEFYKTLSRRMQLHALAEREAHYRAQLADPKDRELVYQKTLAAIRDEPTAAAFEAAKKFFADTDQDGAATFRPGTKSEDMALILKSIDLRAMAADHAQLLTFQKSGEIANAFDRALRTVPLVKYLYVNFLRTPLALLKAGMVDRNPALALLAKDNREAFGALTKSLRDSEAALERGGAEGDLVLARMTVGAGLLAMAWGLWANGDLVGRRGEPGSTERQDGILPYSLKLPDGTWLQFNAASPLAEPLGLVADVAQALRDRDMEEGHAEALFGGLLAALGNNVTNKTFLAGLSDLMEVLQGGPSAGSDKARGETAKKAGAKTVAARIVPLSSLLKSIAQERDPVVRDARTLLEMIEASTPLLSESLPARRDFMGRPLIRKEGERGMFQAFSTSHKTADPLEAELGRLATKLPDFKIDMPDRRYNGQPITSEEYSRLLEIQGQKVLHPITGKNMEETLRDLIKSPEYAEWPELMRADRLKHVISTFRGIANREVRDRTSPNYMGEMVRRTGAARLQKEVGTKNLDPSQAVLKARRYGLDEDDEELKQLQDILFPEE